MVVDGVGVVRMGVSVVVSETRPVKCEMIRTAAETDAAVQRDQSSDGRVGM